MNNLNLYIKMIYFFSSKEDLKMIIFNLFFRKFRAIILSDCRKVRKISFSLSIISFSINYFYFFFLLYIQCYYY